MSPLPRTCKCVLQRELKASRLNLRLLSISHVDHVIRKVFRCEKRNEKCQGPSGDEGRGYEPRHAGELNTETQRRSREEAPPQSFQTTAACSHLGLSIVTPTLDSSQTVQGERTE